MKIVNAAKINDMQMLSMKNQAKLANTIQKIGKGKRKIEVNLSKGSQKYLDQMIIELKKQMETSNSMMPNIMSFFDYLSKLVHVEKGQKRPKVKTVFLSFEEQDFLTMQINSMIKEAENQKSNLKWYNLIKKLLFSSMRTQNELLLKEIRNKK